MSEGELFKCTNCQKTLPLNSDNFPVSKRLKRGYEPICRVCTRERAKKYRVERGKLKLPCPTPGCKNTVNCPESQQSENS